MKPFFTGRQFSNTLRFLYGILQPDIWEGKTPGYGYTHLAECYGILCYYHTETKEVKGVNWVNENILKVLLKINRKNQAYPPVIIIKKRD